MHSMTLMKRPQRSLSWPESTHQVRDENAFSECDGHLFIVASIWRLLTFTDIMGRKTTSLPIGFHCSSDEAFALYIHIQHDIHLFNS